MFEIALDPQMVNGEPEIYQVITCTDCEAQFSDGPGLPPIPYANKKAPYQLVDYCPACGALT